MRTDFVAADYETALVVCRAVKYLPHWKCFAWVEADITNRMIRSGTVHERELPERVWRRAMVLKGHFVNWPNLYEFDAL
jgi:hypothetical protein